MHYDLSEWVSEKSLSYYLGRDNFFGNFVAIATMLFYICSCYEIELLLVSYAGILN